MNEIPKQALNKGIQIAVYEIKDALSSNLSEITYRVWNEHLNATVILKEFFPSDYVVRDKENQFVRANSKKDTAIFKFGLNNFIQQNEKLLSIQHPSVQSAHNVLKFNHTAYLAVEDEQGTLLSEQLEKSKSFTEEELRILMTSLLNALQNIHEAGIAHGDIHPDNILIRKNGEPVLTNIATARQGFAKHVKMLSSELHQGYASPEQYEQDNHVETSVDLYGLGATLFRCVIHTNPIAAKQRISDLSENKSDPLKLILDQTDSDFSEGFLQTIAWMLQPNAKERPQTVSEVLTELNKENNNLKAVEVTSSDKNETQDRSHVDSESEESYIVWIGLFAGMIGFVAIGLGLIWYMQKGEINWGANLPDQEKQISEVSVQKSGSGNSSETPGMQSAIQPKLEKQTLSKVPEEVSVKLAEKIPAKEVPVKSAEQEKVTSKAEVITDKLSPSEKQVETDLSNQDVPALKPSEGNSVALTEPEKTSEFVAEKRVLSEDDLIKQHMSRAKEKFVALDLTTPSEDNAYYYYKSVLKIDPDHKGAAKGLRRIVDRYVLLIDTAIEKDQVDLAEVYLNRAKNVLPNSPYIKKKNDEIVELKQLSRVIDEYEKSGL